MRIIYLFCFYFSLNYCYSQDFTVPDSIASVQSCNAFGSINDGHPNTPYFPFFQNVFESNEDFHIENGLCLGNTFGNKSFMRNSLFTFSIMSFSFDSEIIFQNQISSSWQQRWIYENDKMPTISTLFSVNIPIEDIDANAEYDLVFIVVKNLGSRGVLFLNSFLNQSDDQINYAGLIGHKTFLTENTNLFLDLLYGFDKAPVLELAYEYNFDSGSVISPGVKYIYDMENDKRSFLFGVSLLYQTQ